MRYEDPMVASASS